MWDLTHYPNASNRQRLFCNITNSPKVIIWHNIWSVSQQALFSKASQTLHFAYLTAEPSTCITDTREVGRGQALSCIELQISGIWKSRLWGVSDLRGDMMTNALEKKKNIISHISVVQERSFLRPLFLSSLLFSCFPGEFKLSTIH